MSPSPLPLPAPTRETHAYWTSGAEGRLMINHCGHCGYWVHPPGPLCPRCYRSEATPAQVSGTGTLYSFTVNHQSWLPDLPVPFVLAVVELDEQPGLRVTANLLDCPEDQVRIGLRVRVCFEAHGEIYLPQFRVEPPFRVEGDK